MAVTGCYGNADSFITTKAKLDCKRIKECDRSRYDDAFNGDMGRCRDDIEDTLQDLNNIAELANCEYDPDEGRLCIKTSRALKKTCGSDADRDILDDCEEVFQGCGVGLERDPEDDWDELAPDELVSEPDDEPVDEDEFLDEDEPLETLPDA